MAQETLVTQQWRYTSFRKYVGNTLHWYCSDSQFFSLSCGFGLKHSILYYVTDIFRYLVPGISIQNACEAKSQIIPIVCQ